jgi:hypothetical protein
MSRKSLVHKLSFKFGRRIGRRLAPPLALGLLLVTGGRE